MGGGGMGGAGAGGSGGITTCPGAPDPTCSCLKVTRDGNDAQAVTSGGTTPFRTVQAAIDYAGTGPAVPLKVCVAGFDTCGSGTSYPAARMRDGVSVYGRYESTGWTRCSAQTTVLTASSAQNVLFASDIARETVLDGFRIEPASVPPVVTVTLDGARNAVVTNVEVASGSARGIDVLGGADVRIEHSRVEFLADSIGIRVMDSKAVIEDDVVRGPNLAVGNNAASAIWLDGAVGSRIVRSSLDCTGAAHVAAVRILRAATGIEIRESSLVGRDGGMTTRAIHIEGCGGTSPLITNNLEITASSTRPTVVSAISVDQNCHAHIENNPAILVSAPVGAQNVVGISCGTGGHCVILGNRISNAQPSFMAGDTGTVTGVACAESCVRIADNDIVAGSPGCSRSCASATVGVSTGGTTLVERNQIAASSATSAYGVYVTAGAPRLQNNVIRATIQASGTGGGPVPMGTGYGVLASATADVHSNTILATREDVLAPGVVAGAALWTGGATFRNNILFGGVRELGVFADPAIFENNNATIYFDEASGAPTIGAAAINALTDMTVSGTIDQNPAFVAYPGDLHLTSTSPCIGAGTTVGAPADDKDGQARTPLPDIGAYEGPQSSALFCNFRTDGTVVCRGNGSDHSGAGAFGSSFLR